MNPSINVRSMLIVSAFVVGLIGCQQDKTAEKAGQKIDQAAEKMGNEMNTVGDALSQKTENATEFMDDSAITARVKTEILKDPMLKATEVEVSTTNGIVKLSGVVDSQQSIDRIQEIARGVKDIKSVENDLLIKEIK